MKLFILDDDVNTFDEVIRSIQINLTYPNTQASSIAHIVHHTGKCLVKTDSDENIIKRIYKKLKADGLNVKIEE